MLLTKVILDSHMSGSEEKDEPFVAPARVENQNKIFGYCDFLWQKEAPSDVLVKFIYFLLGEALFAHRINGNS
jgi:hypothetical protein